MTWTWSWQVMIYEVFMHSAVLCASVLQMVLWEYKQTKGWEAASESTEQNWLLPGEDQWEPQWWIYYLRFVPLFLLSQTQSPSLSHSLSFECLETSSTSLPYSLVFLSFIISFFIFFLSHLQFSLWSAWRCSLHFINLIIFCLRYPLSAYPPSFQASISLSVSLLSLSISLSFHPTACNTILVFHVQLTKRFSVSTEE